MTNFLIQKYYQNDPKFKGVYSRNNLQDTEKDGTYINIVEYKSVRTQWMALYVYDNHVKYFVSFGDKNISKEIKKFIDNKNIIIRASDSIMYGYFCIGFVNFMFKIKRLTAFKTLLLPNDFKHNDKVIPNSFLE